jgi:hypothetical protein
MMPNDPLFGPIDAQQGISGFGALARKAEEVNEVIRKVEAMNGAARIAADINPCTYHLAAMDAVSRAAVEINPCTHHLAAMDAVTRATETLSPFTRHLEEMDAITRAREQAVPEDPMQWINDLRIPIDRIETHLPEIHFPESHSLAELEQMPDDEIRALLDRDVSINTVQIALRVLAMRHLERATRPHWTVLGTFWSSVITGAIGVAIGAITVFLMLR